jgi:hypothetical protein
VHRAIVVLDVVLDSPSLFPTIFPPWMGDWEEARSSATSHLLSSTVVAACTRAVTGMTRGAAMAVASSPRRHAPLILLQVPSTSLVRGWVCKTARCAGAFACTTLQDELHHCQVPCSLANGGQYATAAFLRVSCKPATL